MKFARILWLSLLYLGMILILLGLIAATLPLLENEQIRLILASFEAPATNPVLGFINQLFLDMIRYHLELLIVGGGIVLLSLLFLFIFKSKDKAENHSHAAHAYANFSTSTSDLSATPAPRVAVNWRRPVASSLELETWKDDTSLYTQSALDPLWEDSYKPPSTPASVDEPNPYLSYGQSAYAPPAKPEAEKDEMEIPPQLVSILPSASREPEKPGEIISNDEQSRARQADSLQPPKAFHIPRLSEPPPQEPGPVHMREAVSLRPEPRATEANHNSALGAMPPIRIRSTLTATEKPADPPSLLAEESDSVSEKASDGESGVMQKPRYLSKRIRSTIGMNTL